MKGKLTLTAVMVYDLKPELYPQGFTEKEMLAADIANYEDDPAMLLDMCDSITVTGSTQPELSRFLPEGNQHPKAKELGILNGIFSVDGDGDLTCPCADTLFGIVTGSAHMHIAADALNKMNEVGHTSSQMVEIIRELRICLTEAYRLLDANERHISGNNFTSLRMTDILTKTEDFR